MKRVTEIILCCVFITGLMVACGNMEQADNAGEHDGVLTEAENEPASTTSTEPTGGLTATALLKHAEESAASTMAEPTDEAAPATAPEPELEEKPVPATYTARLAVVGDLMVHDVQLRDAYNRDDNTYSFSSSFEQILPYLADADYTIGNLETPLAGIGAPAAATDRGWPVFNAPDEFAEALKEAGFDFVTTANNHANDRLEAGIVRTIETLNAVGIEHAGTYATKEDQERIFIKEISNIRFAFLAYANSTNGIPLTSGKPYLVSKINDDLMRRQIEQARQEGAEVVVVLPHMGEEYRDTPTQRHVEIARNLCLYGADIVMASHPHVLQPTEVFEVEDESGAVRTCFIAYSMGNFISGMDGGSADVGAVFYLDIEKTEDEHGNSSVRLTHASFAPTWVQFRNAAGERGIRVLPLGDTLTAIENNEETSLSERDITRLRELHRRTLIKMLGDDVDEILPVYTLFSDGFCTPPITLCRKLDCAACAW